VNLERLTATEARVAGLVAGGRTNREISAELALGRQALGNHLNEVYRKLGVRSRTELALFFGRGHEELPRPRGADIQSGGRP
jgi:DNA-binding CsgD family transcriptional regulator